MSNAFSFEDNGDIDELLASAAAAGTAATEGDEDFSAIFGDLRDDTSKEKAPAPVKVSEPEFSITPEVEEVSPHEIVDAGRELFGYDPSSKVVEPEIAEEVPVYVEPVFEEVYEAPVEAAGSAVRAFEEPVATQTPVPQTKPAESNLAEQIAALQKETEAIKMDIPAPARPVVSEPDFAPKTVVSEPYVPPTVAVALTEGKQIENARLILAIAAAYDALPEASKDVVSQLIAQEPVDSKDTALVAVKALNSDPLTFEIMASLKEAQDMTPVDRAFYILGLEKSLRESLGTLVTAFTGVDFDTSNDLQFSRSLVIALGNLDEVYLDHVRATESVLRIAKSI